MKIHKYTNHEEYVAVQIEANIRKLQNVWVDKQTIKHISSIQPQANTILCHGTRNAAEQKYFQEFFPNAEIVGTEISHTAKDFPMTVQWDFHEVNPDWIEKFDIVYSNAIDHSYDPTRVLSTWKDQLTADGRLYIEHGYAETENYSRPSDPLEIHDEEIRYLITSLNMTLLDVFETTGIKGKCPSRVYVVRKENS